MAGVEDLYKQFGILADAKEKAGEVSLIELSSNISNQIKHGADLSRGNARQNVSVLCKPNGRCCFELLFLTARECFSVDIGCCEGFAGRETAGFSVYSKVLQVLPKVAGKCY